MKVLTPAKVAATLAVLAALLGCAAIFGLGMGPAGLQPGDVVSVLIGLGSAVVVIVMAGCKMLLDPVPIRETKLVFDHTGVRDNEVDGLARGHVNRIDIERELGHHDLDRPIRSPRLNTIDRIVIGGFVIGVIVVRVIVSDSCCVGHGCCRRARDSDAGGRIGLILMRPGV